MKETVHLASILPEAILILGMGSICMVLAFVIERDLRVQAWRDRVVELFFMHYGMKLSAARELVASEFEWHKVDTEYPVEKAFLKVLVEHSERGLWKPEQFVFGKLP